MPTLGQILKETREKKGVTASQAAAATRMKVQVVEALERDDFSRMAAPMYAKGFLKLYGEYLGLDTAPLIREYMDLHAPKVRPLLAADDASQPREGSSERKKIEIDWTKIKALVDKWKRPLAIGAGVILLLVVAVNGITRCSRRITEPKQVVAPPVEKKVALPVLREPPDPYIETSSPAPQTP
jgi:cytoskeletal protein RodZ